MRRSQTTNVGDHLIGIVFLAIILIGLVAAYSYLPSGTTAGVEDLGENKVLIPAGEKLQLDVILISAELLPYMIEFDGKTVRVKDVFAFDERHSIGDICIDVDVSFHGPVTICPHEQGVTVEYMNLVMSPKW